MNIVIVGQGAIGLLWYHQLIKNVDNSVSLLCSTRITSTPAETLFTNIDKQITVKPLILADNSALNQADIILFCVKSYQLAVAITSVIKEISVSASIVLCHNGMGAITDLSAIRQPCYALLTTHASKIITPFHAQHTGLGHNDLGLINGQENIVTQENLVSTLSAALPSLTLSDNIKAKQWLKLAINSVINPITARDNINNGQLLNSKYTKIIEQLLVEIIAVAAYEGIRFDFEELKAQIFSVASKTKENCSSMRSDILHKRPTEIDYINGYIANLAKKAGLSVPQNQALVQQIKNLTPK